MIAAIKAYLEVNQLIASLSTIIKTFFSGKHLLSHNELQQLIKDGVINAAPENVNASSIDITLDNTIMAELLPVNERAIRVANKETIHMHEVKMGSQGYNVMPGEFLLASSREIFNLPGNISAEYKLKSSQARVGMEHLNAGWCDAGWTDSKLTLEFKNMTRFHELTIEPGMKCGQVVFFRHKRVPKDKSYAIRGQYNNQKKVTQSKGMK